MAELLSTGPLAVDLIEANDRLRPVTPASVQALIESITQLGGVMIHDVSVRTIISKDDTRRYVLMAGGHRLAAAKALGWPHINAKVYRCDDNFARLVEVDDNLANADLSALDLCNFIAERHRLFLLLRPDLRQGSAGASARWGDATITKIVASDTDEASALPLLAFDPTKSFAESLAAKRGLSASYVYKLQRVGKTLSADQKSALGGLSKEPGQRELLDLADLEPQDRDAAIQLIASGDQTSLKHAVAAVHPKRKPIQKNDAEAQLRALRDLWSRVCKDAKRDFVTLEHTELTALMTSVSGELAVRTV